MNFNWSAKKDWSKEDKLYSRKRNVSNKGSRTHEHIIGSIYSYKMERSVQYESLWGECLFYYLLELDPLTVRYYEQSVEVPLKKLTKDFILKEDVHVPDVLNFREGSRPHLYQIKGGNKEITQDPKLFQICSDYALKEGWDYTVVNPKTTIPRIVKENILNLVNYLRPREYYNDLIPEIKQRLEFFQSIEVLRLAKSFEPKIDYRYVLPLIFHLIATGVLMADLSKNVDSTSHVSLGTLYNEISSLFDKE